jgi:hypothetical protein
VHASKDLVAMHALLAQQQALQAPSVAWSMPLVQCSAAPIARVAARGGHHRLHVRGLHGFDPGGVDSTRSWVSVELHGLPLQQLP